MNTSHLFASLQATLGADASIYVEEAEPDSIVVYRPDEISGPLLQAAVDTLHSIRLAGGADVSSIIVSYDTRLGTTRKRVPVGMQEAGEG